MFKLVADRLILRLLVIQDAVDFLEYRLKREAKRFQGWIPEKSQEVKDFIQLTIEEKLIEKETSKEPAVNFGETLFMISQ